MIMGSVIAAMALVSAGGATCFAAARAIPEGTALSMADVTPVPCKAAARAPLRYDAASGDPIAFEAMPAGTYLGRLAPLREASIPAGTELTLRSSAGVVTIERRVIAIQPGRSGERVFVRAASGEVFSVPLALDGQ